MTNDMHKDVQELRKSGIDVVTLRNKRTYLIDEHNRRWKYKASYTTQAGVEIIVLTQF